MEVSKSRKRTRPLSVGVLDFFCGSGGTSCGFKMANVPGIRQSVIGGIDNDKSCCATFERMIGAPADAIDIAALAQDRIALKRLQKKWELERFDKLVVIGCAPCQGFAAHRKSIHERDLRRSLFVAFCQIAKSLKPDAIFMENVPDLFSKRHWPYYREGRETLESAGYFVRSRIYNLAGFGLPQERFRAVMVASKLPFTLPEPPLAPDSFRTVRQTIGHLQPLEAGEKSPSDSMHVVSNHRPETVSIIARVPKNGGNRPMGVGPKCLDRARLSHGGYTDVYGRLAWDRPSVTLTGKCRTPSAGRFAHPEQDRGLSIREAALLQGFPNDYVFEGNFDSKFLQVGNAVPPLAAKCFAEHLYKVLAGKKSTSKQSAPTIHEVTGPVGYGFAIKINGIKKQRIKDSV